MRYVTYEQFGAKADGITDDMHQSSAYSRKGNHRRGINRPSHEWPAIIPAQEKTLCFYTQSWKPSSA